VTVFPNIWERIQDGGETKVKEAIRKTKTLEEAKY
jgi:hypothetical protein